MVSTGTPKLQYFDAYGRAEPIRMAAAVGNLQYTDERLSQEDFGKMKMAGEFPMGSVPVWIEDGVKYCQSNTVLRLVGMRTGQYPTEVNAAWDVDSAMEAVEDNMGPVNGYVGKQVFQGGKAEQADVDGLCKSITNLCSLIERRLYGHGQKYIAGSKATVADFKIINVFLLSVYNDSMPMAAEHREACKAVINKWPKSKQYIETTMPALLKDYLSKRASCPF